MSYVIKLLHSHSFVYGITTHEGQTLAIVRPLFGRGPTGLLDDMPIFVDQTAAAAVGVEGNLLAGEDTASQNVLVEKIFGGKKLVVCVSSCCIFFCNRLQRNCDAWLILITEKCSYNKNDAIFSDILCISGHLDCLHSERGCYRIPAELFEMELHRPKDFEVSCFSYNYVLFAFSSLVTIAFSLNFYNKRKNMKDLEKVVQCRMQQKKLFYRTYKIRLELQTSQRSAGNPSIARRCVLFYASYANDVTPKLIG